MSELNKQNLYIGEDEFEALSEAARQVQLQQMLFMIEPPSMQIERGEMFTLNGRTKLCVHVTYLHAVDLFALGAFFGKNLQKKD